MSIQELLGLPPDVTQPNAYQLFGLELGEPDPAVVKAAISRRIVSLKKAKPEAPADLWKRAAVVVQSAKRTLEDPVAKAELDASFGIVNEPPALVETPPPNPAVDPLAALLPTSAGASPPPAMSGSPAPNSYPGPKGMEPNTAVESLTPGPPPDTLPVQPVAPQPVAAPVEQAPLAHAPAPVVRQRRPTRRRKSKSGLLFGTLTLLLLASIVGGMGYFYFYGPGEVQFVKTGDGFQIKTGAQPTPGPKVGPPRQVDVRSTSPTSDRILRAPERGTPSEMNSLGREIGQTFPDATINPSDSVTGDSVAQNQPMSPNPTMSADANMNLGPMSNQPSGPVPPPAKPTAIEVSKPPSEAEISVGQLSIDTAIKAIRAANWNTMKTLAEMSETKAVTPAQKQEAETVYQYADLATFYRGGIQKALAELPTNSEIKVTETRKVLVNEADEQHLKINLGKDASGKPNYRNYLLDELPLVLAHELASYKVDIDTPEGQAAKAAYQAIASLATPGHRAESVEILRGLNQVEGADPKRLATFVESLGQ